MRNNKSLYRITLFKELAFLNMHWQQTVRNWNNRMWNWARSMEAHALLIAQCLAFLGWRIAGLQQHLQQVFLGWQPSSVVTTEWNPYRICRNSLSLWTCSVHEPLKQNSLSVSWKMFIFPASISLRKNVPRLKTALNRKCFSARICSLVYSE